MAPRPIRSSAPLLTPYGVALPTALVMLIVILVLGLAAIRMTATEERMAGYSLDRALAFQAAEAGLREAEERVALITPMPAAQCEDFGPPQATVRACPPALVGAPPRWENDLSPDWFDIDAIGAGAGAIRPRVLIEYLGKNFACDITQSASLLTCRRYRVTVIAGGNARANVMLQSLFATD